MLKVLQITDLHILPKPDDTLLGVNTEKYFKRVLQHAHEQHGKFDLILVTGDLAQYPCPESYQRILTILQEKKTPCLCLPGNHDDALLMRTILNQNLVSCHKHMRLKNWQIICLDSQKPDSQEGLLAIEELEYLNHQLKQESGLFTLIAVHHHCISSHSEWMDTMIIENRDALFKVIDQYPQVKAVTTGHIHQLLEKKHNSVSIFGTPATCFQFEPGCHKFTLDNKPPGYRTLNLYTDGTLQSKAFWLPEQLTGLDFSLHSY
jgi:Icc protein